LEEEFLAGDEPGAQVFCAKGSLFPKKEMDFLRPTRVTFALPIPGCFLRSFFEVVVMQFVRHSRALNLTNGIDRSRFS
jgi:hypothetical protein